MLLLWLTILCILMIAIRPETKQRCERIVYPLLKARIKKTVVEKF